MVSIEDFGSSRRGSSPLTTTRPKWSNYVYSIIILAVKCGMVYLLE